MTNTVPVEAVKEYSNENIVALPICCKTALYKPVLIKNGTATKGKKEIIKKLSLKILLKIECELNLNNNAK